ncbi:sidestep protein, putative [Ixodes scapularis]|uniref:Sidestep protein, putative n=1 Tax=Ixodes scapularis TaxID=6945 RepID=B7PW33_IXOSC|nr:sidestep protein, putative [Ixodes scapularis]|eukprot:XP_002409205.1 sidestep protein, putative [Ixodes scapularis]
MVDDGFRWVPRNPLTHGRCLSTAKTSVTSTCFSSEKAYGLREDRLTPAQVRIKGSRSPVSADVEAVVECETTGSQPAADVSWSLENVALRDAQVLARGANGTASLLRWTPRPEDDGRRLICRAVNNRFPQDVIEDVWLLDVHCSIVLADKPRTELRLGSGLDPWGVQEGHDVYFECSVQANPAVHEVSWSLDGRRLTGARLIVSNLSLALRQVTRHQAGQYRCAAHNSAGHAVSNAVPLRVKPMEEKTLRKEP